MKHTVPLILASASPRRKALLSRLGVAFKVRAADIDETPLQDEHPLEMTERLACAKARAILEQCESPCWVLGSDTTVALGDRVFGKPSSHSDAVATLRLLSGNTHQVISSVCLAGKNWERVESVTSHVRFGSLSESQIEAYCATDEPWDKAGGYGIQGLAGSFVEHIDGDYSAIVGLPLWTSSKLLRAARILPE